LSAQKKGSNLLTPPRKKSGLGKEKKMFESSLGRGGLHGETITRERKGLPNLPISRIMEGGKDAIGLRL